MIVLRSYRVWAGGMALGMMFISVDRAGAQSGTMMSQTATFINAATAPSIELEVAGSKSANTTTKIFIEVGTDGASASPPADPNLPPGVRFRVSKTGVAMVSEFTPTGGADNTTFANKIVVLTKGAENPGDPRGLYVLAIAHLNGTSAAETWKVEITNLPAGHRTVASIDQGVFKVLTPTGVCGGGTTPPPCPGVCPPGYICQRIFRPPWDELVEVVIWPKWPLPGPPCLSCPPDWRQPVPDGFDRVMVGLAPLLRENAPLGPGRAGDIKVSIDGGQAVGPVFDVGDGSYMQLVQHRAGDSPRVRASVGDVMSEEVTLGRTSGVNPIFRTLTYALLVLLIIAIIILLRGRRQVLARG